MEESGEPVGMEPSRDQEIAEGLRAHLKRIIPPFIPQDSVDSIGRLVDNCFDFHAPSQETVAKFISSSEQAALVVEVSDSEIALLPEVKSQNGRTTTSIILIKTKDLPLDNSRPMYVQVQVASVLCDSRDLESSSEVKSSAYLQNLQQLTRHFLAPIARTIHQNTHATEAVNEEDDPTFMLQKKVRELDFLLEQCQRGSSIPSISLPIPPSLVDAAKAVSAETLHNYLDRYNATQVDAFFGSIQLSMGDTEDKKEEFANSVNKTAKLWPAEIIRQTRLIESPFAGTVEKEINFWKDLDRKLNETKEQMESSPILLTKLVLKRTNRVSEQLIHEAESVLDRALKVVNVSLTFLRDFPIDELQGANNLTPKLARCVANSLSHFSKLKHSQYDYSRAVRLLEVLGNLVFARMVSILEEKKIMHCSMSDLAVIKKQCDEVFSAWSSNLGTQRTTMREVAKRRNENFANLKFELDGLQRRIDDIFKFRTEHDHLLEVFTTALSSSDGSLLSELSDAFQIFVKTNSDLFDISPAGAAAWTSGKEQYNRRLEKLDERITHILEERLGEAKTADEMFRIFSIFNPLFYRPTIRSAVNSFRATLMKSVREDVKKLQDKFRLRYDESHERVTADLRDIPPLSGRIIWARQIENQLSTLMERIQNVLGQDWEDHPEGKQLKDVCDALRGYLGTQQIYEDWITSQIKSDSSKYSKAKDFLILVENDPRSSQRMLKVNFDEKQLTVYKEVQYLEWLLPKMNVAQKTIPSTIKSRAKEAFARYPVALALEAAIVSYGNAQSKVSPSNLPLLTKHIEEVRELLNDALGGPKRAKWIRWDSPANNLNDWVNHLVSKIYNLQERIDEVTDRLALVDKLVGDLSTCEYDRATFETIINGIQAVVDELPNKGLANVLPWVQQLDQRMEEVLRDRLRNAILSWVAAFSTNYQPSEAYLDGVRGSAKDLKGLGSVRSMTLETPRTQASVSPFSQLDNILGEVGAAIVEETPTSSPITLVPAYHEITVSNQLLYVQPALELSKRYWISEYHEFIALCCTLPRIAAGRFQVFEASQAKNDYSDILDSLESDVLRLPYITIEKKVAAAKAYVQEWLQYQALWDASISTVAEHLGRSLPQWRQFLTDVKVARASIDTEQDEKSFGPLVISHHQAQNKINLKYDAWQRDAQLRFGAILLEEIKAMQAELIGVKSKLESISFDGSTKDAIVGVHFITQIKESVVQFEASINELKSSEKLLQTQRFNFPNDWLPVSNVMGVFSDLSDILDRRSTVMNAQLPVLQQKIREEDQSIQARMEKFLDTWNLSKPVEGTTAASAALEALSMFSGQLSKIAEDARRLCAAKESLRLDFIADDRLSFVEQEIIDLREAWSAIAPISDKLQAIGNTSMKDLSPPRIRKQLEDLIGEIKLVPSKLRSYAAVEVILEKLQKHLGFQPLLRDLSTEALKDRHWKVLLEKIGISVPWKNLTVGHVWASSAMGQRKFIGEVLATAQGELALEQFLHDLRDHWVSREMVIATRDGAKIVAGWEGLFSTLEDNLNAVASLKQSPYFRNVPEFQEDAVNWENRLTNLRGIFDVWIEVQRKWLYLRGIFKNNDIKAQLPAQFTKFKSIDNEYSSLMKRMSAKPLVLEVLQVENLHRQLEREDTTMALIQKALGEYLESQRQIFPRFYFVNNDDLVEIIGNSNEPAKIMVHLGKMFAAIAGLRTNLGSESEVSQMLATAMVSKEGEHVELISPIDLGTGVKEWLGDLHSQMAVTMGTLVDKALTSLLSVSSQELLSWVDKFPAQICILAIQLMWTRACEAALRDGKSSGSMMESNLSALDERLQALSLSVLQSMEAELRQKTEQLLTEMVHQRDVTRSLIAKSVMDVNNFGWLYHLRFYWNPKEAEMLNRLQIKMSNASFHYGFEYLGIGERLVQTPLTDRCYLTLTQALHFRMGGNPFGPAGTGKTESVKMLGSQLGRFVLVFNCDSSFDYAAMGRIFSGLCQVGAWGCFDEFNRLEERILSAVSQQILTIQRGLLANQSQIDLLGESCKLSKDVGIFVTLNPGYAGRSNLPDNLKQLFRAVAMSVPDRKLIAQVMLFSQGIATAEDLAGKIVLLFVLCEEQLSSQSHYDFGLRALKSVLVGAGELKRQALGAADENAAKKSLDELEKEVLLKSTCDSVLPKLVAEDIPLFVSLLAAVFPGSSLPVISNEVLITAVRDLCAEECLEVGEEWLQKIIQLKQIQDIRHGIMMVGPSGTGKTTAWRILLKALGKVDGVKGDAFVIDPKSIKKEKLFGSLDPNTLEWTDGVFTKILRRLADPSNVRGTRRSWIVFDGDVDPEWAENLNSVLDDNKILTLPSGDRLKIPPNVRIMMEVDNLKNATLATVSRCGMIWFADNTVSLDMVFKNKLAALRKEELRSADGSLFTGDMLVVQNEMRRVFVDVITPYFLQSPSLVEIALQFSLRDAHVMECKAGRLIETLHSMLVRGLAVCLEYNESNVDFPMTEDHLSRFASKWLIFSLLWSFGSSLPTARRVELSAIMREHCHIDLPGRLAEQSLLEAFPNVQDGEWVEWSTFVPRIEIESHKVSSTDVVVTTTDTVRHIEVLKAWLSSRQHLILCGPPGSGKTMTLTSVLESLPEYILAPLSFSSGTTPDIIMKTFAQYCEVVDSPDGLTLQPNRQSYRDTQWLVIFCDEINLPAPDAYGTQRVIMFMRQLAEHGGFWNNDCKWVHLRRIQFVGACNPPTDAGRVELSSRFLRRAPVLFVDYPAETSLKQIYRCFNQALLRMHPNLKGYVDPLNDAMVELYLKNKEKFTADLAPQYIYSPRELSRWVRAMYEAMEPLDAMTGEELVRLWGHEALRLFQDRLIDLEDKEWCSDLVDATAARNFPGVDVPAALKRPILYSQWLKKTYQSTERESLRDFVAARLRVFYEEALDVPLVIFDEVLDHVLRIDNVLRHPVGHMLLVGESGVGKTVLTRFVAWINGLNVFQIKANSRYTIDQFDDDLRSLFRRVGVEGEKICFIFDESNALSSAFLERMNALLASGEVPGLFEGDDRTQLLAACRESFNQREGSLMMDSEDELFRRFTKVIQRNLHVVFTMNPLSSDFSNRCTTSPALFNRCVVDWFGTWSLDALVQVGYDFTKQLDTGYTAFTVPRKPSEVLFQVAEIVKATDVTLREAVVAALVNIHHSAKTIAARVGKASGRQHYLSPRDFLDLINKFIKTEREMKDGLEDQQTHVRAGLQKLLETQDQVAELNKELLAKNERLKVKDNEANAKLSQMVEKQNEAEQRKAVAEQLTTELARRNEEIRVRKDAVEKELSEAEPALISAKQSVQNIRKNQLDEVRALPHPPAAVRLTMEMVSIMIGEASTDWGEIRKVIRRDDFIATVVNFDPLSLTPKQIKTVTETYLSNPELDTANVDRASKACGPLCRWAGSQIKYATILKKIKPLRDEMLTLQDQSQDLSARQQAAVAEVEQLEEAIKTYKAEYAAAIRETEIIRTEMTSVSRRVSRANALLSSLQEEKVRWEATAQSFELQMSTLIGDCLLSSAFLTYAGIFDHKIRKRMMADWAETMESLGIPYRSDLDMVAYLSRPADQLKWLEYGLPNDTLAMQNAILLERFNRFPLVIDPSGQALRFLMNKFASQRITATSFLDAAFLKTLVSSIRFGNPLLVQDVESLDPILNPVLNREVQRTGGRTVIRLGTEDVDFSPKFLIILLTRNPMAHFSPDLCSRVTVVNFTVTPASLESQVLSEILKTERPDVDRRRSDVLRLQGEQNAKLRELQDILLDRISAVQGAILDDDTVINTLEGIKADAAKLNTEVGKTVEILDEVRAVSSTYLPLAMAISSVFFTMESLAEVCYLYQYSLQYFLEIVHAVLQSCRQSNVDNSKASSATLTARINSVKGAFFKELSRRVLPGLLYEDKLVFLVRLAQIATQGDAEAELTDAESDLLTKGSMHMEASAALVQKFQSAFPSSRCSEDQAKQFVALSLLPSLSELHASLTNNAAAWMAFLESAEPEKVMPLEGLAGSAGKAGGPREALLKAVIVRSLRPERALFALEDYISVVFAGFDYDWRDLCTGDLRAFVERDSKNSVPVMLCSQVGQDASSKVDVLSSALNAKLLTVSMGSAEGFAEADKLVAQASKSGYWVLLRNVHLCPEWLGLFEKKLHNLVAHDKFRLFLTCEINDQLPPALLRASEVLMFESSSGIKASLQRFFASVPATRIDKQPLERARLYGLFAWFNAVVQERLRYAPLGWTKRYEFNDADVQCSLDVIDQWVDEVAGSRTHVDPQQLPWQALQTLLFESLYGGRVDQPFDQAALESFVRDIVSPGNYAASAVLVRDSAGAPLVTLPDSLSRQALEAWVKALPDSNSPAWIGLPVTAENQLRRTIAQRALSKFAILEGLQSVDDVDAHGSHDHSVAALRGQHKLLADALARWMAQLPGVSSLQEVLQTAGVGESVLARTLIRELQHGVRVLSVVNQDLSAVHAYTQGRTKLTNLVRDVVACYRTATIPKHWKALYPVNDTGLTMTVWMEDLIARMQQLLSYASPLTTRSKVLSMLTDGSFTVHLGRMFSPEAFIIACRQETAHGLKCSLEDLDLCFELTASADSSASWSFAISGLLLQGAEWDGDARALRFSDDLRHPLHACKLKWCLRGKQTEALTSFPVYLNESRKQLVCQTLLPATGASSQWAQRSVAVLLQSPHT